MKKALLLTILLSGWAMANSQGNVEVFFSQNYSTFRFVDSEDNKEDLDYVIKFGYGIGYQYVVGENLFFEGSVSYNEKGASSTLDTDVLDWSLYYVSANAGIGYRLELRKFYPHGGAGLYYGRLLKADQFIGSAHYDLMTTDDIGKNDFGFYVFAGMEYAYSNTGSVFIRLNESVGLWQLEGGNTTEQKMFNRTFSLQLGLSFEIRY